MKSLEFPSAPHNSNWDPTVGDEFWDHPRGPTRMAQNPSQGATPSQGFFGNLILDYPQFSSLPGIPTDFGVSLPFHNDPVGCKPHPDVEIWEFEAMDAHPSPWITLGSCGWPPGSVEIHPDLKIWEFEDLKIWEFEAMETHPDQIFPSPIPTHFPLEFFPRKTQFFYQLCPQNIPKVNPSSGADPGLWCCLQ